jgi:predicted AAA+ superfamily ATPase
VKKYGAEKVHFWRTTDKKEIDFIVKDKNVLPPIEAKLNFFKADVSAMKYFSAEYSVSGYKTVALYGGREDKATMAYPWELIYEKGN